MMWKEYNPNPTGRRVGDCAVRAIAKALGVDWETAYGLISAAGYAMGDMPSSDSVWGAVLRQNGFYRAAIPNTCPDCYTVEEFCLDHPVGTFVVKSHNHVATVKDGILYDAFDSEMNVPYFYWYRKDE